jgi:hypothetical protein
MKMERPSIKGSISSELNMMEKMNDAYLNSLPPEERKAISDQMK